MHGTKDRAKVPKDDIIVLLSLTKVGSTTLILHIWLDNYKQEVTIDH